jgi:hypothetical protein
MTTNIIIQFQENKHYCVCYHYVKELNELKDQITCLQKSIAYLRKDLYSPTSEMSRSNDRRFWIHGKNLTKVLT